VWRFCVARANLAADADVTPENDFLHSFPLPADCLRVLQVGAYYPSVSLSGFNGGPIQDYQIEGRYIVTRSDDALPIRYLRRVTDAGSFDATFIDAFAADLAVNTAEALTQSGSKRELAMVEFRHAIRDAVVANALEMPPEELQDDTWVVARL
jgi:hypothetical protein